MLYPPALLLLLPLTVQLIIDRIVFLRIAEGKGIETFGALGMQLLRNLEFCRAAL